MSVASVLLGVVLAIQVPPPAMGAGPSEQSLEREAILGRESKALEALADRLAHDDQADAAKEVLARLEPGPSPDGSSRFVPLPEIVGGTEPKGKGLANVPAGRGRWREELETLRRSSGKALFELATRAAGSEPKQLALADECLRLALARDPNHPEARRLLGYVPQEGGWATPFAVRQLGDGKILDPTYGWIPAGWLPHLDKGELPAPSNAGQRQVRWLPAAEADELHRPWASGWTISTEHFEIHSNVPLAEAISFGRQLESLHDLFFALLADVIGPNLPLAQRFQDKTMVGERASRQHSVFYFATKAEYADFLRPIQGPSIEESLGFYDPPKGGKGKRGRAYFFRDADGQLPVTATLHHEVSHQLLFESAGPNAFAKNVGNFWVFEGLGTYFETLETHPDGSLSVGGLVGPRIEIAQVRLIDRHEFIPIAQFVLLDQNRFNDPDRVHLNYAEAIGLTVFLMQAQDRRYREPFLDYVRDAYRGRLKRASGRSLEDRLGVPAQELDGQFLAYLRGGPVKRKAK